MGNFQKLKFPGEEEILPQDGNIETCLSFQPAGLPFKFQRRWFPITMGANSIKPVSLCLPVSFPLSLYTHRHTCAHTCTHKRVFLFLWRTLIYTVRDKKMNYDSVGPVCMLSLQIKRTYQFLFFLF